MSDLSSCPIPKLSETYWPNAAALGRWRLLFWFFAALLFTLTHWPNLQIPNPVQRTDIILHMSFFGPWTILCIRYGWFGPPLSMANIWKTAPIAVFYAAFDEGLQAIPWIQRTASIEDFGANCAGVFMGATLCMAWSELLSRKLRQSAGECPRPEPKNR